jgi:hypothetical protein
MAVICTFIAHVIRHGDGGAGDMVPGAKMMMMMTVKSAPRSLSRIGVEWRMTRKVI